MSSDQEELIKSPERPSQPPPPPPNSYPESPTSLPSELDPQLQLRSSPQEKFSAPNLYVDRRSKKKSINAICVLLCILSIISIAATFYLKSQWSNYTWFTAIASVAFSLLGGSLFMYKLLSSDDPNPIQ